MNKKDLDLKLWSYIQDKANFFDLPSKKVTELLNRDMDIDSGITKLKSLFPVMIESSLVDKYKPNLTISGKESIIYWDKNDESAKYIYKLNSPEEKFRGSERFNEIILYYVLQEYLFPKFKYEGLKIYEDRMFIRQKRTEFPEPTENQIKLCMEKAGYYLAKEFQPENNIWIIDIKDIKIMVGDLNSENCSINKSELEVFDPALRIYYENM